MLNQFSRTQLLLKEKNMREEKEITDNVLEVAIADDNVRTVIRTNLLPIKEYLHSFQFYFVVNDVSKYEDDKSFETCFGERILLFRGDKN